MILLDTNVVSEPLRQAPDIRVVEWIDAQALETLFLSAITVVERRAGVALRPAGKRRAGGLAGKPGDACVAPVRGPRAALSSGLHPSLCGFDGKGPGFGACSGERRWLHRGHRRRERLEHRHTRCWPLRGRRGKSDQPVAGLKASAAGFTPRARPPRVAHEEQVSGMTHLPEELTQRLLAFRAERDWAKFHNARSVAAALSVEASELVEHFS